MEKKCTCKVIIIIAGIIVLAAITVFGLCAKASESSQKQKAFDGAALVKNIENFFGGQHE